MHKGSYYKAVNATTRTCLKYGSRCNSLLSHERFPRLYYYTDKSSCQNVYNVSNVAGWYALVSAVCSICTRFECHCHGANCRRLHEPALCPQRGVTLTSASTYIYNTCLFSSEYAISAFHATPAAVLIKTLMRYKVIFIRTSPRLLQ